MKLLFTLTAYPPSIGGAQIHHHQLAVHLKDRHDIQVLTQWNTTRTDWLWGTTLGAPGKSLNYTTEDITVHRIGVSLREKWWMSPFVAAYYPMMLTGHPPLFPIGSCLRRHLEPFADKADLIHNVRIGREGLSIASYRTARLRDIPFVLTAVHHPRWEGIRYTAFTALYAKADALLAMTQAEKRTLMRLGTAEERIHVTGIAPVLESSADPGRFLKENRIDTPMVLFLGQHFPYKGYKELLNAAEIVWKRQPDTNFVFIGPDAGRSKNLFRAVSDPRVHRLGITNLQDKTDALAACTVLCVPSTQESFGGVYIEAFASAKPVIGCNIPAVAEVVEDGVDGYLVEQEPEILADRILYLIKNESLAQRMGEAGKKKAAEKFTWERISARVEKIYQNLV